MQNPNPPLEFSGRPRPVTRLRVGRLLLCIAVPLAIVLLLAYNARHRSERRPSSAPAQPADAGTPMEGIGHLPTDYQEALRPNPVPDHSASDQQVQALQTLQEKLAQLKAALEQRQKIPKATSLPPSPPPQVAPLPPPQSRPVAPPPRAIPQPTPDPQQALDMRARHSPISFFDNNQQGQADRQSGKASEGASRRPSPTRFTPSTSSLVLHEGTLIPVVLQTGINSNLPGPVKALVRTSVYDSITGEQLVIPQGTTLLCRYNHEIAFGQNRVMVTCHRLLYPNGDAVALDDMPAMDRQGFSGLKDKVNHHFGRLFMATVFSSALGIGARASQGNTTGFHPTVGQQAATDVASSINQAGQQIVSKNLQLQPTIEIRPGERFSLYLSRDLVLPPYRANL